MESFSEVKMSQYEPIGKLKAISRVAYFYLGGVRGVGVATLEAKGLIGAGEGVSVAVLKVISEVNGD